MLKKFETVCLDLRAKPKKWLVTGAAGFIGSNLVEALLKLDQVVIGVDNFSTGHKKNLDEIASAVTAEQFARFHFIEADVSELQHCHFVCKGVHHVLHQAALGSVPRSIDDPIASNLANVNGFLNMLVAAKDAGVESFTYAASSSTYGDHPGLPKVESEIGNPLSPYAVTKYVNELYAGVFAKNYGFKSIGLRYFNVFGQRQDPAGAYAAVIPKWTAAMLNAEPVIVNGDGETSRDFCFIENVVHANILAATAPDDSKDQIYNIAVGQRTTLNELFDAIRNALKLRGVDVVQDKPVYQEFRTGDVRHSLADISKAQRLLGYQPKKCLRQGVFDSMPWYIQHAKIATS